MYFKFDIHCQVKLMVWIIRKLHAAWFTIKFTSKCDWPFLRETLSCINFSQGTSYLKRYICKQFPCFFTRNLSKILLFSKKVTSVFHIVSQRYLISKGTFLISASVLYKQFKQNTADNLKGKRCLSYQLYPFLRYPLSRKVSLLAQAI